MAYDKCSLIVNSEILETQNYIENKARKEWKAKWGFYLDLDKIILDEAKQRGLSESEYKRIVINKKPPGSTEPYIWITHSNRAGPMTSSGAIGWRALDEYSLEKFGPLYRSPKFTVPQINRYSSIFLG